MDNMKIGGGYRCPACPRLRPTAFAAFPKRQQSVSVEQPLGEQDSQPEAENRKETQESDAAEYTNPDAVSLPGSRVVDPFSRDPKARANFSKMMRRMMQLIKGERFPKRFLCDDCSPILLEIFADLYLNPENWGADSAGDASEEEEEVGMGSLKEELIAVLEEGFNEAAEFYEPETEGAYSGTDLLENGPEEPESYNSNSPLIPKNSSIEGDSPIKDTRPFYCTLM